MSSVINISALINHVTSENRFFYERHETSCDMSPKKGYESFHIFEFKIPWHSSSKSMFSLLAWGRWDNRHIWARQVTTAKDREPQGIFFLLVGFVSLSLDRVIQVVMDDLVYYPFHFVEKSNPEHSRKNCKVLRVVRGEG